jgi:hypothetical protein
MENKIRCRNCAEGYFQKINFEGIIFDQCSGCGRAVFPEAALSEKLGPAFILDLAPECLQGGRILASQEQADQITAALQDINVPKEKKNFRLLFKVLSTIAVSAAGLAGIYFLAYRLSEDRLQSVLVAVCVGLPTLYLINLALGGLFPNMVRSAGGEEHADIEDVGHAADEIWQELRPWILGGLVLFAIAIWGLFQLSLPRAYLYRFIGWLQKPYSNYLDVVLSKDKAAFERMCDWYLKAQDTHPGVFGSMESSEVDGICKAAGRNQA